jgi:hypothetical protein
MSLRQSSEGPFSPTFYMPLKDFLPRIKGLKGHASLVRGCHLHRPLSAPHTGSLDSSLTAIGSRLLLSAYLQLPAGSRRLAQSGRGYRFSSKGTSPYAPRAILALWL